MRAVFLNLLILGILSATTVNAFADANAQEYPGSVSVVLHWPSPTDTSKISSFRIYYWRIDANQRPVSGFYSAWAPGGTTTGVEIHGLDPNATYRFTLAQNSYLNFETPPGPPTDIVTPTLAQDAVNKASGQKYYSFKYKRDHYDLSPRLEYAIESSADLKTWTPFAATILNVKDVGNGKDEVEVGGPPDAGAQFFRARAVVHMGGWGGGTNQAALLEESKISHHEN